MSQEPKKVLIFLTKGLEQPMVARSALLHATASALMDIDTTLYCAAEGAEILVEGAWKKEVREPGTPTLKQRLDEAKEAGVKFSVCEQACRVMGIKPDGLIDGVEILGAATMIDRALDYDAIISF